jgi:hypothetical protein
LREQRSGVWLWAPHPPRAGEIEVYTMQQTKKLPRAMRALTAAAALSLGLLAPAARAGEATHDSKKEAFGELSVDAVEKLIAAKEASIFDNNDEGRYAKSHLPTAKWVKFNDVQAADLPKDLERKLVFYCANSH